MPALGAQGFNAYQLIEPAGFPDDKVVQLFESAQRMGLTVARTWAFNYAMPAAPGVYDETQFRRLDFIVQQAGNHGIKLVSRPALACCPAPHSQHAVMAAPSFTP